MAQVITSRFPRALRRARLLRGMKQSHLAEQLSVTQATVCRWERGTHVPSPAQMRAAEAFICAPPVTAHDAVLKRLVETSARPVHLICDATHRLLAASPSRQADWGASAHELCGRSLWQFASHEIEAAEARLDALGWCDGAVAAVTFRTGATSDPPVPIVAGQVLWERMRLEDGREARLVSTFTPGEALPAAALAI